MKRFLAFGGDRYYAGGGMYDFIGDFDTIDDAIMSSLKKECEWYHIYDSELKKICDSSGKPFHSPFSKFNTAIDLDPL